MSIKLRKKRFSHRGIKYTALIKERPFREGLEVEVNCGDSVIHVAELGLGERALIERLKEEIDTLLGKKK